jgi:hypothetical protein
MLTTVLAHCCTTDENTRTIAKAKEVAEGFVFSHTVHNAYKVEMEAIPDKDPR